MGDRDYDAAAWRIIRATEAAVAEEREACAALVDAVEASARTLATLRFMAQVSEAAGPAVGDAVKAAYEAIAADLNALSSQIRARSRANSKETR